jgi:copper chaperone CopZ
MRQEQHEDLLYAVHVAEIRETLTVEGIHCLQCPPKIGAALAPVPGVLAASASLAGDVTVRYDDAVPGVRAAVVASLAAAGFPVLDG